MFLTKSPNMKYVRRHTRIMTQNDENGCARVIITAKVAKSLYVCDMIFRKGSYGFNLIGIDLNPNFGCCYRESRLSKLCFALYTNSCETAKHMIGCSLKILKNAGYQPNIHHIISYHIHITTSQQINREP